MTALIEREAAQAKRIAELEQIAAGHRDGRLAALEKAAALESERDALAAEVKALRELKSAAEVLIEEWDRNDSNKFDIMPAKDWEKAEKRFRSAIDAARAEARND